MKKFILGLAVFGTGFVLGTSGTFQGIAEEVKDGIEVLESSAIQLVEDKEDAKTVENEAETAEVAEDTQKSYWVGTMIGPVPEVILAHVSEGMIPEGKGVCVMDVVPDSPAEKGGLKKFDVVVKVNGNAVNGEEFVKLIKNSDGKKIACEVLRGGKVQTIDVTPAERPEAQAFQVPRGQRIPFGFGQQLPPMGDVMPGMPKMEGIEGMLDMEDAFPEDFPIPQDVRDMLKKQRENMRQGFQLQPMVPQMGENMNSQTKIEMTPEGTVTTRTMTSSENGDTLTVSVRKKNDEPGKVLVEWNDEAYEATEDNLEEIPETIRPRVKKFLESNSVKIQLNGLNPLIQIPGADENVTEADTEEETEVEADAEDTDAQGEGKAEAEEKEIKIQKKDVIDLK
ncbi:MAG: PDZ domain-containing protein [Planctomycetia bacterium]|nr:PDZ domain-containing protein [Planctomycetia bacterium]